jgi:hypothetical protein
MGLREKEREREFDQTAIKSQWYRMCMHIEWGPIIVKFSQMGTGELGLGVVIPREDDHMPV